MRICPSSLFLGASLATLSWCFVPKQQSGTVPSPADNAEVKKLVDADQADRESTGKPIDWKVVTPRDHARNARILEIYKLGGLNTAQDYARAALVLQHAEKPDDVLLAHEFCVVSVAKGNKDALWLAAAAEDRFLMDIDRPQRFGTQYRGLMGQPVTLYKIDDMITDKHRAEMHTPSLEEAKKREKMMQDLMSGKKGGS